VIVLEMELVELTRRGRCHHANTECELRCMVFGQLSCLTGDTC
jgi:hypothetical protein